ncbi:MAG TPA: hypothetical protein DCQ26_07700 [Marinilabiliales bacterium]|nr:MAG: hypothetical protein A2W84_08875 [Bacteroidetes bacterium GWC2_40_13]OFX71918.1 MAG: hypothetical protein A2W96_06710 [Bacteroidetes bacterium GWD2_40_43]OFX94715.1 MAG: hypothetical protein A2W97_18515 [Bacteroidetes bacterium GWE2_40_63]OFY24756.1 MAG: hypothetical protein A2W88_16800 [Bacteroidetes bacterium GWF2_40_13]OFZ24479.1 MAG: hypothetical protein A2437_18645 [Bacteroidetes bacterium RIFOXYC2_FULL_40_12]HAM98482.1 hypothetical protein [Marinilabiliales bacterium]
MKLSKEHQKKLLEKLKGWSHQKCEVCSSGEWSISDTFFEIREFRPEKGEKNGLTTIQPYVTMSCRECGNTKFFNAIHLGIVDKSNPNDDYEKGGKHE